MSSFFLVTSRKANTMFTPNEFQKAAGISDYLRDFWFDSLLENLINFDIITPLRIAHFIAQIGYESVGFSQVEESLNYSEASLLSTFHGRITPEQASAYGRTDAHPANQKMIGNIVYSKMNGNGDIDSGDGYNYRGRGLIQTSGKGNYSALLDYLSFDVLSFPDLLCRHDMATCSAAAYWGAYRLNYYADKDDVQNITQIINGGQNGIEGRKQKLALSKSVFC